MQPAMQRPLVLCAALFGVLVLSVPADLAARPRPLAKARQDGARRSEPRRSDNREFNRKAKALAGNGGEPVGEAEATDADPSPASAQEEDFAHRAYPLDTVPLSATMGAIDTWTSYGENKDGTHSGNNVNQPFVWDLQGPTHALQPGILSFSGAQYHMAGRVTALALTPQCTPARCRLWMAAAGGGIWRTDNPLSPNPYWVFVSAGFKTNAVGTIDRDPADPSGNTLYAGTGEPNASGDSESGVGIYKTTDGGDHWTLLPGSTIFNTRSISKIVASGPRLLAGIARGVRGVSSVTGGAVSRTQGPIDGGDQAPLGLYESTDGGASFHLIWNTNGSIRGVNNVAVDPNGGGAIYVAAFQRGIWRCSPLDGCNPAAATSAQFQQVFGGTSPLQTTNRSEFALTSVPQPGGAALTRIYVLDGAVGPQFVRRNGAVVQVGFPSQIWRADAANTLTAAALRATEGDPNAREPGPNTGAGWARKSSRTSRPASNPYRPAYNICEGQCWYDAFIYTPEGFPDVVYAGGSYAYNELHERSNGRGVILSTTGGDPDPSIRGGNFSDMTWDDTPGKRPDQMHPDQHAIITPNGQPFLFFEGSDGGLVRSDGAFDDASADCVQYHVNDADTLVHCQRVLSRVPHQLFDTLNVGLSTLQFQSVSLNPFRPLHNVQGGTQDNGTFDWESQITTWDEEMYGDGGQSGYNYADDTIRFNSFFGYYTDENFRGGQPDEWVVTSGPLSTVNNGEASAFYMPIVSDYTNYGFQYAGTQHVWRTVDNGGPQAYLEANCPEFTTSGDDPRCGDWRPLGDPTYAGPGNNESGKPGDLTSALYGADRPKGVVAAVERSPGDNVTLWAATSTGRVFVSHNANNPDSGAVVFCRLDNLSGQTAPPRFPTSIHPDPANPNRAWISYSGYNQATPAFVGHAFEVTATGAGQAGCPTAAVWRDLGVEQGSNAHFFPGDIPVTDFVRDDLTGDLYAATDFGVLRSAGGTGFNWTLAGANLPFVEVAGLTIDPCSRALYAATHGRSIWRMFLPAAAGAPSSACPRTP